MKIASKSKLRKLEIEISEKGFTIWIKERSKTHGCEVRHWIVDGSLIKENGYICIAGVGQYPTGAVLNETDDDNVIKIVSKY